MKTTIQQLIVDWETTTYTSHKHIAPSFMFLILGYMFLT
jgi:hypothetical protein